MKRILLFLIGCAGLVALTWYAGAGAVGHAFATLGPVGLLIIAMIHVPVVALVGVAWWVVARDVSGAAWWKFVGARFVRNAGGEILPFSQLGGFALGVRVLCLGGVGAFRSALSMFADLVMEFAGKLPYAVLGVLLLLAAQPASNLLLPLSISLGLSAAGTAVAIVFRSRLKSMLESSALVIVRKWTSLAPSEEVGPAIARIFASDRLALCFTIHLLGWVLGAGETWAIFALMGIPVTLLQAVVIDSLVGGIRTFAFMIPASAGVQEGAYVLVCALFGIGPAGAVAFSLARRAREVVLGLPVLAGWQVLEARTPAQPREQAQEVSHEPVP